MTTIAPFAAVALVLLAGLPIGYVVLRDIRLALLVAPLVTGLTSSAAVMLMLVFGGRLLWWLVPLLLAQWAATPVLLRTVRTGARAPHASWTDLLWLTLPLVPPFLTVLIPPTRWDSNSIWWLHAAYFTKDAAQARQYIGLPSIEFSHPDYPPLLSAAVAAAWSVLRGYGLWVAQFVSATLNFSAIAMLGYAVRVVTGRAPALVSRLAAASVAVAAWGAAPYVPASGYCDALWSAAFVAAALLLLFRPDPLRRPVLAVLLLAAVALTKNEGLVMAAALAVVATIRVRRQLRRTWVLWLPVGAGLSWSLLARHLGARSDVTSQMPLGSLLRGDAAIYDRLPPTLSALWDTVGPIVAVSVVAAILGAIFLRRQRNALDLGADLWLWALALVYLPILVLTYLINGYPIKWYLGTSIDRVTLPIALVAVASAACWAVAAVWSAPPTSPTATETRGKTAREPAMSSPTPTAMTPSPPPSSATPLAT